MKRILFFSILSFLVFSCAKDDSATTDTDISLDSREVQEKVDVCHLNGNGEYHTITINANALDAHLAHGDYEGECTDCDPASCFFCDENYIGYFDFDEPCDEIPWRGDFYCQGEINSGVAEGCDGDVIRGWARLVDYDSGYCFEDPEGENDEGELWAIYRTDGCGNYYGQVNLFWWDNNDPDPESGVSLYWGGLTQEAYDQAYYCATVIEEINAALATPLVNQNAEGGAAEGEECLQLTPDPFSLIINEGKEVEKTSKGNRELFVPPINNANELNLSLYTESSLIDYRFSSSFSRITQKTN